MRADRFALLLAVLLLAGGCRADDDATRSISGDEVARMAEVQLQAQHPALAPGTLTCSDLEFVVGATARCARTSRLSRGRQVRVLGTVSVTSVADGGKLHVQMDQGASSFSLRGEVVARRVAAWLKVAGRAGTPECPDLPGVNGRSITCEVEDGEDVEVVVTGTVPATYDVQYRIALESD